jgi:hypothetical protein
VVREVAVPLAEGTTRGREHQAALVRVAERARRRQPGQAGY